MQKEELPRCPFDYGERLGRYLSFYYKEIEAFSQEGQGNPYALTVLSIRPTLACSEDTNG
jgi:hypothetical protein